MSFDFSSIFFIVIALMALQPLLMGRWYAMRRAQAIRAVEKEHGARVITMIHRQERRSLSGFAVSPHIDLEDAQSFALALCLGGLGFFSRRRGSHWFLTPSAWFRRLRGIIACRRVDFLRRQASCDIAHLLARIVAADIARESFKLRLDIVGGLAVEMILDDLIYDNTIADSVTRSC